MHLTDSATVGTTDLQAQPDLAKVCELNSSALPDSATIHVIGLTALPSVHSNAQVYTSIYIYIYICPDSGWQVGECGVLGARGDASQERGSRGRGARIRRPGGQDPEARGSGSGGRGARIQRPGGQDPEARGKDPQARRPRSGGQGAKIRRPGGPGSDDKIQRSGSSGARSQWSGWPESKQQGSASGRMSMAQDPSTRIRAPGLRL